MRVAVSLMCVALVAGCTSSGGSKGQASMTDIQGPPVKVNLSKLQMVPAGAGYTILKSVTNDTLQWALKAPENAQHADVLKTYMCQYDADQNTIATRAGAHAPGDMMMFAVHARLAGKLADLARARGHSVTRTTVTMQPVNAEAKTYCYVAIIDDGDKSADEHEQELVRIFTAARQVGVRFSCFNVDGPDC